MPIFDPLQRILKCHLSIDVLRFVANTLNRWYCIQQQKNVGHNIAKLVDLCRRQWCKSLETKNLDIEFQPGKWLLREVHKLASPASSRTCPLSVRVYEPLGPYSSQNKQKVIFIRQQPQQPLSSFKPGFVWLSWSTMKKENKQINFSSLQPSRWAHTG